VVLALAAFVATVLANPQIGFGHPTFRPIEITPRLRLPPPTPVPKPFRNPAIPPRFVGREGRQVNFGDLFARFRNATSNLPGVPAITGRFPGISNLPNFG